MWQRIKNYYHLAQAFLAAVIFNFPSNKIKVIGVTGTDGKTTTVHMIYEIIKASGQKVSMISSVGAAIGSKAFDTGFHVTTPSSWQVQKYLRKAADSGHKYFVLETTSHGLDQNRLAYVHFEIGVLTNITHDHLDYHGTWENYAASKAKLFKNVAYSILNYDDHKSFSFLQNKAAGQVIPYGIKSGADINTKNFPLKLKIKGDYNLENALASAAATKALGVSKQKIVRALAKFSKVPGRMEEINLGQGFNVIVDFAHTPNALSQALRTLKPKRPGRLMAVFGAAGERDKLKRPIMGRVADENADIIILTAEDPRNEKVLDIASQIKKGIKNKTEGKSLFVIEDREKAIGYAINLAAKNDIVGIFGKGHEKSMCFGKKESPWDEFHVTATAIRRRVNGK
ncbi:MAG: UDP-N-acetylmuramoyl-L-alanyl-D-glutamate--2,6-diaminopimelate ligase [Candidatus Curtissbacteria bacterium]|nr:UDP-N-acetylmuramoyl-L-alanyl-D-glutamate--2,6-diaminopimelate ligase [Candidatus Curtissbacteria bacterium]